MDELQGHLTAAGVMNAQETAEALSEQDIEWTLLVDIFARPDSDGGRTGVSDLLGNLVRPGTRAKIVSHLLDTRRRVAKKNVGIPKRNIRCQ